MNIGQGRNEGLPLVSTLTFSIISDRTKSFNIEAQIRWKPIITHEKSGDILDSPEKSVQNTPANSVGAEGGI